MKQLREGIEAGMSRLASTGAIFPICASAGLRPALAAPSWRVHLTTTMPSLHQGHGEGHKAILANGTRRLKEPST
ncbi:MAG TPA: hypothetical protein VGR26_09320 [Acidimicrobiales bacterium]|nr:hypothetical protein [Acidimicrobiales bacterium]